MELSKSDIYRSGTKEKNDIENSLSRITMADVQSGGDGQDKFQGDSCVDSPIQNHETHDAMNRRELTTHQASSSRQEIARENSVPSPSTLFTALSASPTFLKPCRERKYKPTKDTPSRGSKYPQTRTSRKYVQHPFVFGDGDGASSKHCLPCHPLRVLQSSLQ